MFWNLLNRLGSIGCSARAQLAAGRGTMVRPGRGAGGNHRALLPQAEAAARQGVQHAPVAEEPGGPARQQPLPAAAAQPAALSPASGRRAGDACPGRTAQQGDRRPGAALRAHDRQLGQHGGDRRAAQPTGKRQGEGQEGRHRRWTATTWPWSISFGETARVVSNYTGDKRALLQRIDSIPPTQSTTSLREALQVAAGLANPSKQIGEGVVATSALDHAQIAHLHRRRLRRRRGLQPGQSRAGGRGDRPAAPPLLCSRRRSAGPHGRQGQGSQSVRQRGHRRPSGSGQ